MGGDIPRVLKDAQVQQKPKKSSPLPAERAFVVQVSARAELEQDRWEGRVEHVTSGHAKHFRSREELLAFMARVLRELRTACAEPLSQPAAGQRGRRT